VTDFQGFKGAAKKLDDIDIPMIAKTIDVGEDELHAIIEVETSGGGFDKQDRPKMLFEPHVFYRQLEHKQHQRQRAIDQGLAYKKWGTKPYPPDSYPRLQNAMIIDESSALQSCSWGLGQIMGFHYKMLGYESPQELVWKFMEDEEYHLVAMVKFIEANNIDDDLRRHDWAAVARVYNGTGYATNKYDVKLREAYAKWSKIKDTPIEGV